jgi:hypothetical protein
MWDLTRISMRICIENGYHKKSSMKLKPIEDQLRRRVFWTSYICDRHSSSMLGRPLAIEEDEIEVEVSCRVILILLVLTPCVDAFRRGR